jgi:hypothetical protein
VSFEVLVRFVPLTLTAPAVRPALVVFTGARTGGETDFTKVGGADTAELVVSTGVIGSAAALVVSVVDADGPAVSELIVGGSLAEVLVVVSTGLVEVVGVVEVEGDAVLDMSVGAGVDDVVSAKVVVSLRAVSAMAVAPRDGSS